MRGEGHGGAVRCAGLPGALEGAGWHTAAVTTIFDKYTYVSGPVSHGVAAAPSPAPHHRKHCRTAAREAALGGEACTK